MENQICPKTWLAESIFVTLFCCLPFGIIGIIYASKVENLFTSGMYEMAQKASSDAAKWTKIGFITGLVATLIYLVILVAY